jgi:exodeoxyribonuclease V alpha subunit
MQMQNAASCGLRSPGEPGHPSALSHTARSHTLQGSEYAAVVLPLTMQAYTMLQRNLLYTGVTRGKRLVVLIAEPKALKMAVSETCVRAQS